MIVLVSASFASAKNLEISDADALRIGKLLWKNECNGTVAGLTSWNTGETFASLGIGHFIWYPKGQEGPFDESFPRLVRFLEDHGIKIPEWIAAPGSDCPWNDRESFLRDQASPKMKELRSLLEQTIGLQARFAALRMAEALPKIIATLPEGDRDKISSRFSRVYAQPSGLYALMDYVNFKGEGIKLTERYQGQGWGLLQVLELMRDTPSGAPAVHAFADAATAAMERRVRLSPPERNEIRWLPGWKSRIESYRP